MSHPETNNQFMPITQTEMSEADYRHCPVILVLLSAGAIELIDVPTQRNFKMSTTIHVGAALDLIKQCPFSHKRVAVDDENVAADILQTALQNSGFVDTHASCVLVIRPAPAFVGDISKTELISLSAMVKKTGYDVAEIQFFLKPEIEATDWQYFYGLQQKYAATNAYVEQDDSEQQPILQRVRTWIDRNM